jgi:hypothetical protein
MAAQAFQNGAAEQTFNGQQMFPSSAQIAVNGFGGNPENRATQMFGNSPIQRPELAMGLMHNMGAMIRTGTPQFGIEFNVQ